MSATPIQFQFYDEAHNATLSGGSWLAGAPLTNLQVQPPQMSLRARSTDDALASTKFQIDLGASPAPFRMVGVARHNLSLDALVRITGGTSPAGSDVFNTGWLDVWPAVYLPEDLEWEDDNFWTGQLSSDEIEGYPNAAMADLGANYTARYVTIEFDDTANPDGYVELAHLRLGKLWSPTYSYAFGAGFGWEDRTDSEYSLGGAIYSDVRPSARVLRITLKALTRVEGFGQLLDAQRILGTHTPFWVVPSPDDTTRGFKRNFLARFRRVDPITQAFHNVHELVLELEEWL